MKGSLCIVAALIFSTAANSAAAFPPLEISGTPDTVFFSRENVSSRFPALDPDGTWVAWYSDAKDIINGDDNGDIDVFARDIDNGTTVCISVNEDGSPSGVGGSISVPTGLSVSAGGEFIAFVSHDPDGKTDVFVRDMKKKLTHMISKNKDGEPGNGSSLTPSISRNGRYIAFSSSASNLVDEGGNGFFNIFIRDMEKGSIEKISTGHGGEEPDGDSLLPSISWDGRMIAFSSSASNLVPDQPGNLNSVFVFDRATGKTFLTSVNGEGNPANGDSFTLPGSMSGDGRSVLFFSTATNLTALDTNMREDLFIHDLVSRTTIRVSLGGGAMESVNGASSGALDYEGRVFAFLSDSDHIVPGDINAGNDIFVRDTITRRIEMISRSTGGDQVFSESADPALSGKGNIVAFSARPLDLFTGKGKNSWEIFIHDRTRRKTFWISAPMTRF